MSSAASRHLSWLVKSCFPSPQQAHHPTTVSVSVSVAATIASLPDDLLLECLVRVPHSTLPTLPSVCRRWAHLINSAAFQLLRRRHRLLVHTIFAILISNSTLFTAAIRMHGGGEWKLSSFVPSEDGGGSGIVSDFGLFLHSRLVSIGRTAMLRCDTWTGSLVHKAGMHFPRKKFAIAVVDGKILVAGGCRGSSAVEEYNPEEDAWRVVSDSPRRRYGCIGASADGVFYIIGGLTITQPSNNSQSCTPRASSVSAYASSMDLYNVASGTWLRSRAVPCGGCVVAACAAGQKVYVLSSHAVELSFWKLNGLKRSNCFGEWRRVQGPPLPAQVRLDGRVRFSCVGVGEKVVLVQVAGCIDDLLQRSGRAERARKEGLVLVYDCAGDEWSRVADMPEVIRRATCVCVEC